MKKKKTEEARLALQRWCNVASYDDWGFYTTETVGFFENHPEYVQFKSSLKINWNMFSVSTTEDATGIPEVTVEDN